jgi:hypothetical protein
MRNTWSYSIFIFLKKLILFHISLYIIIKTIIMIGDNFMYTQCLYLFKLGLITSMTLIDGYFYFIVRYTAQHF